MVPSTKSEILNLYYQVYYQEVPPTKINLPEILNLYYQVYYQEVPPTKINSVENLKIDNNI